MATNGYKCPNCNTSFLEKSKDFPFCSARCRLIDLGAWAKEQYRIKGPEVTEPESGSTANEESDDVGTIK